MKNNGKGVSLNVGDNFNIMKVVQECLSFIYIIRIMEKLVSSSFDVLFVRRIQTILEIMYKLVLTEVTKIQPSSSNKLNSSKIVTIENGTLICSYKSQNIFLSA